MKTPLTIIFFIIGVLTIGLTVNDANAELSINNAFILEGSGFAVTEEEIKISEIDFAISTGTQQGSTIKMLIEDGFVTLNDNDFLVTELGASGLREGRYIRVSGTGVDTFGEEATIRLFGRLVENSAQGSIYGFTGSLTHDGIKHKVIYTTSLSGLTTISLTTKSEDVQESELTVHIRQGSSNQGLATNYIQAGELRQEAIKKEGSAGLRANYFSPDRVSIEPGTSVTFVNDDDVAHRIVSGTGLGSNSRVTAEMIICESPSEELPEGFSHSRTGNECAFTFDGRVDSGIIEPGESWTGTFDDAGFYRIIDPNYPWMNIVVYSFPESGSQVLR